VRRGSTEGSVLIVTLWASALLVIVAVSLTGRVRLATRAAQVENRALYARHYTAALARIALATWQAPTQEGAQPRRIEHDVQQLAAAFEGALPPPEPARLVTVIAGESGKANVNRVSIDVLTRLVRAAGAPPGADSGIANAIADWRDADSSGLAEADLYARGQEAYRPADADLVALEDLLFVDGVTPELFHGEDRNHNGLLDPEEDDGALSQPNDNSDGQLQRGLCELLTVHGEGIINVNVAPEEVLRAVLEEVLDPAQADQLVQVLLALRRGSDGLDGTLDDRLFATDEDLAPAIAGAIGADLTERVLGAADWGVKSDVERFHLHVFFPESSYTQETALVVVRENETTEVREWRES
jgi:type II secretory pathway component PulK